MRVIITWALFLCASLQAEALFTDNFDGSAVDSSLWNVNVPYSDSGVRIENGEIVFRNGGSIITKYTVPTSSIMSGSFRFTGSMWDRFSINLRANGALRFNSYGTYSSDIYVELQHTGGESGGPLANITISHDGVAHSERTKLGVNGRFNAGTVYNFKIEDDGSLIKLFVEDLVSPILTATTSTRDGYYIALGNREGSANGSSISAGSELRLGSISIIPEPSALSLLAIGLGGLAVIRRRRS
jgi:hypothetical protein